MRDDPTSAPVDFLCAHCGDVKPTDGSGTMPECCQKRICRECIEQAEEQGCA